MTQIIREVVMGEEVKNIQCKNCGAGVAVDGKKMVLRCAFCDSEYIVEVPETDAERHLREEGSVIGFKVEKVEARGLVGKWVKKGLFKPSDFLASFQEKEFSGIYIPSYKVSCDVSSTWSGTKKHEVRAASDGEPAEYEYHHKNGTHDKHYDDFIVASGGLDQDEVDRIQPFDHTTATAFKPEFMLGYSAEKPSLSKEDAVNRSKERIREMERTECTKGLDSLDNCETRFDALKAALFMLPLWVFAYIYKGKAFRVLVNAQTGKVRGKKPVSWLKVLIAVLIAAGLIVGLLLALKKK